MDILLKPDALSLSGSMKHFVIAASNEVSFMLKVADGGPILVQHTYTPNKQRQVEIDIEGIVQPLLSFKLRDTSENYQQAGIIATL